MQKELEGVKFILTSNMTLILIKYNKLKKNLLIYKKQYDLDKNVNLMLKITKTEKKLKVLKKKFISEFRKNNKTGIDKYLEIKNFK